MRLVADAQTAPEQGASRPNLPGAMPSDAVASQKAANEAATAQVTNQQRPATQEWQSPVSPAVTPDVRQAARSERAILQGQHLQSQGPTETPTWNSVNTNSANQEVAQAGKTLQGAGVRGDTPAGNTVPPSQEVSQAGKTLEGAGVKSQNPPISDESRGRIQTALERSGKTEQTSNLVSRLEAAIQERACGPHTLSDSKSESTSMHK